MTTSCPFPFTDTQQLEVGRDALGAFEIRAVPIGADVYQALARWMSDVLNNFDTSALQILGKDCESSLTPLAHNLLSSRGDSSWCSSGVAHSEWSQLRGRLIDKTTR